MKRIALILTFIAVVAAVTLQPADAEPTLGIGSKAPALDIEFYIEDGDKPVTKFAKGSVYVVEFWATWCGPCIASMPHLADLQTKYRNDKVQIISISDESLDEVEALLAKPYPNKKSSFADVTSPYTLTTDPDRSTYADYMDASEQQGIPTSFLVGKSGLIEWIGHPAELDEPLAAVVKDSWDREAFKEQQERQKQFEKTVQMFAQLAGTGRYDEAGKLLKQSIAAAKDPEIKQSWLAIEHQFNLMADQATEADYQYYRDDLKARAGSPQAVFQLAMTLYGMSQEGAKIGSLAKDSIAALLKEVDAVEESANKAMVMEAVARLHTVDKNIDEAIAAQKKALEFAKGNRTMERRVRLFLSDLNSSKHSDDDEKDGSGDK